MNRKEELNKAKKSGEDIANKMNKPAPEAPKSNWQTQTTEKDKVIDSDEYKNADLSTKADMLKFANQKEETGTVDPNEGVKENAQIIDKEGTVRPAESQVEKQNLEEGLSVMDKSATETTPEENGETLKSIVGSNPEIEENLGALIKSTDDPETAITETAKKAGFELDANGNYKFNLSNLDDRWSMWATLASCVLCAVTGGIVPPINFMALTGYDQRRDAALEQEKLFNDNINAVRMNDFNKAAAEERGLSIEDYNKQLRDSANVTAANQAAKKGQNTTVDIARTEGEEGRKNIDAQLEADLKRMEVDNEFKLEMLAKQQNFQKELGELAAGWDIKKADAIQKSLAKGDLYAMQAMEEFINNVPDAKVRKQCMDAMTNIKRAEAGSSKAMEQSKFVMDQIRYYTASGDTAMQTGGKIVDSLF